MRVVGLHFWNKHHTETSNPAVSKMGGADRDINNKTRCGFRSQNDQLHYGIAII